LGAAVGDQRSGFDKRFGIDHLKGRDAAVDAPIGDGRPAITV